MQKDELDRFREYRNRLFEHRKQEWNDFIRRCPEPHERVRIIIEKGFQTSWFRTKFLNDDGTSYIYWDGTIQESCPAQVSFTVQSCNYDRAMKQVQKLKNQKNYCCLQ